MSEFLSQNENFLLKSEKPLYTMESIHFRYRIDP